RRRPGGDGVPSGRADGEIGFTPPDQAPTRSGGGSRRVATAGCATRLAVSAALTSPQHKQKAHSTASSSRFRGSDRSPAQVAAALYHGPPISAQGSRSGKKARTTRRLQRRLPAATCSALSAARRASRPERFGPE